MRKNIADKIFIILVFCIVILPFAGMAFHMTTEPVGNSPLKDKPQLTGEDGSFNIGFLKDAGDWFESVYAFRPEMITADSLVQKAVYNVSSQDNVISGRQNWLFYQATVNDYTAQEPLSDRMIFNIASNIALLQRYVDSKGADMVFTIAPNKNSLYPEYMPDGYIVTENAKNHERLAALIRSSDINYLDLYSLFTDARSASADNAPLYYARDSHWNEEGAVMVYEQLMQAAGQVYASDRLQIADAPAAAADMYGDLSLMLYPAGILPEERGIYIPEYHWIYTGEAADVTANYVETANDSAAIRAKLVMYRDSFGNSLLPYFAETFESGVFSQTMPYPIDNDMGEGTGLVIVEIVERHLSSLAKAAPLHNALRAEFTPDAAHPDDRYLEDPENDSTIRKSRNKGYTVFEGKLDKAYLAPDSRIYVLTGSGACFEAYCIRSGGSDYGYSIAFSEEQLASEGGLPIYVAVPDKDDPEQMIILCKYSESD